MEIASYISNDYPAFSLDLSVMAVSQFFSDTTHSHFPVVVEGKFLGMLAKEEVENFENKDLNISELIKSFEFFRIDNFQPYYANFQCVPLTFLMF